MSMPVILLIDGDVLAYQVAFSNQTNMEFDGQKVSNVNMDGTKLLADIQSKIEGYLEAAKGTDFYVCLSDKENFRLKILKTYKCNRDPADKPILLDVIKQLIRDNHKTLCIPQLEADDVMGIYSTSPDLLPGKKIIVSIDKDMRTIPGFLYNPNRGFVEEINPYEADLYHMTQTITGDTTDGYTGCPGAGPDAAEKALEGASGLSEMWERVVQVYARKALKDALVQAQVSNILRHDQFNFKKGKVTAWKVPTTTTAVQ